MYMVQGTKLKLDRLEQQLVKDAVCRRVYSACAASTAPTKITKGFGDFKIGGQVICTAK